MAENSIFKTNQELGIYHYPLFLSGSVQNQGEHDKEQARECIQFTAVKQPGVSFNKDFEDKIRSQTLKNIEDESTRKSLFLGDSSGSSDGAVQKGRAEVKFLENLADTLREGRTLNNLQEETAKRFTNNNLIGAVSAGLEQIRNVPSEELEDCFLYMPSSVVFNEGAVWQREELGASGNAIKSALTGNKSIGSILSEFGAGLATPVAKAAAVGSAALLTGAIGGLLTIIGGGGIESGIKQSARLAQNPYEEQLFSGVDFRVFNFNFEFSAVSEEEFRAVQNIITMFRKHSRPTFAISGGNQALYSYPNEFAIKFLHLETDSSRNQFVENTNLPKLHNCVLTNITTNYAPDGWKAHIGGEPNLINVQLAFTETLKNTRTDIEQGY